MSSPILDATANVSSSVFITRFDINGRADLEMVDTKTLPLGTVFQFISGDGSASIACMAELQSGPADGTDASQVPPDNYDPGSNDKHWQVVGGLLT